MFTLVDDAPLAAWLGSLREEQLAGDEPVGAVERLRELADPRVTSFRPDGTSRARAEAVATAVNAVWGTTFDEAGVRAALADGLPAP